jgi:hypothetical protein
VDYYAMSEAEQLVYEERSNKIMADFLSCPAYTAVADYLASTRPEPITWHKGKLWKFNDRSSETEVIEVLRAAAVLEETKEASLANV